MIFLIFHVLCFVVFHPSGLSIYMLYCAISCIFAFPGNYHVKMDPKSRASPFSEKTPKGYARGPILSPQMVPNSSRKSTKFKKIPINLCFLPTHFLGEKTHSVKQGKAGQGEAGHTGPVPGGD